MPDVVQEALPFRGGSRHHQSDEPARGQLKNPPVGSRAARFVSFSAGLGWPWSILAVSDGVWKPIAWDRLVWAVREARGRALVDRLAGMARSPRMGRFLDDFTVVVLEWDD